MDKTFSDINLTNIFSVFQGNRNKRKNKPMGPKQIDKLLHCKGKTIKKPKRQFKEWEKIVSKNATDKGLISKICKQVIQLNSKKPTTQWKDGQKT